MSGKVAFCVVAWNSASVLGECLDALLAQTGISSDVYLLDNASKDDTRELMAHYPTVKVTWSRVNTGFARGNNLLIAEAFKDPDIEYVALINSDAVLAPDWASQLVGFAEQRGNVGSLQGLTLDYFDHSRVDSRHIFVNGRLQGQQYGYGDPTLPLSEYCPRKVFGVNAAACMYTRAMIEALPDQQNGFFDERFYMYYEDVDVSFRALITGWDAWSVPVALAYHMGSVSAKMRASSYSPRMVARNMPAMIYKNAPVRVVLASVSPAIHGVVAFLRGVFRDLGWRAALQTAVSLLRGIARLPIYRDSRRRIQAVSVIDPSYLLRIMNSDGVLG